MRTLFYLWMFFASNQLMAQTMTKEQIISDLPVLEISEGVNLHIISPEPIQYVDLSTHKLMGDLPNSNIARIKIADASATEAAEKSRIAAAFASGDKIGIITVVGQSFIAQYRAVYRDTENLNIVTNIHIQPDQMQPLELAKEGFSQRELSRFAMHIIEGQPDEKPVREVKNLGLKMQLNNVYVLSDYIFLDMTFTNSSNLSYDIEDLKFSIEDKKIYKATNNQSIEMMPVFRLFDAKRFRKNFRNIYVFRKFTFPNSKVMMIRLIEEQLSGRTIELKVNYSDILKADTF